MSDFDAMLSGVERRRLVLADRGVELALLDWGGNGPLALLAHANGFCAALWDPIARELCSRFHVVAYDARGHGDSTKPPVPEGYAWREFAADLIALAEALACEGRGLIYGIGHSFGGAVTLAAAVRRPDLFARVAMLDPVLVLPEHENTPARRRRKAELAERASKRRAIWPSREAAREAWRDRETFRDWDARTLELYVDFGLREREDGRVELKCPREIEAAIYRMSGGLELWSLAAGLRVPALLLFATRGHFERAAFERLAARTPAIRLEDADAGHLLPMEAPQRVAERLVCFGTEG